MESALRTGTYRHFKGDLVQVLHVALDSEDHARELVVYNHNGQIWVRPLSMFVEHVERAGYTGPRFVFIQ